MLLIVLILMIVGQSCDTRMNVDEPNGLYKLIGTDGSQAAIDLVTDGEDNVYILGSSTSASKGIQLYVVKTTSRGIVLWQKIIGGPGDELGKDIEMTTSGDLVIAADRKDETGEEDFVIYKLNADDGSVIGTPTVGGTPNVPDFVSSITEISDGFIVSSYSDGGTFKSGATYRYDASMALVPTWEPDISQFLNDIDGYDFIPVKVVQINPDLFYTFSYTNSPIGDAIPDYNFLIYVSGQFNGFKNVLVVPGPDPSSNERLTSVRPVPTSSGGGYVLGGYVSNPNSNEQNLYVVRIRQDLEKVKPSDIDGFRLGQPRTATSSLSSITSAVATVYPSINSGFLVLGDRNSTGNDDIYLTKVDNGLNDAWAAPNAFGGEGDDMAGAVRETTTGRILVCGTMRLGNVIGQTKIVLMNLNPTGKFDE